MTLLPVGLAAMLVAMVAMAACTDGRVVAEAPGPAITGPLCSLLPGADEPGAPQNLVDGTADEALTWLPVATTFEAAVRAAKIDAELAKDPTVTLLVPTDEAFANTVDEQVRDDLLLFRHDALRDLLRSHIVRGAYSLAELVEAGEVETLAGTTVRVSSAGGSVRLNDRADSVCGDYIAGNARIHVIGDLLVDPPPSDPGSEEHSG